MDPVMLAVELVRRCGLGEPITVELMTNVDPFDLAALASEFCSPTPYPTPVKSSAT